MGGTGFDSGKGIAVDSKGSSYITGQTNSVDFPTIPPYENAFGGSDNIFVLKLNAAGTQLVYWVRDMKVTAIADWVEYRYMPSVACTYGRGTRGDSLKAIAQGLTD